MNRFAHSFVPNSSMPVLVPMEPRKKPVILTATEANSHASTS